jgi:hypothetical protein
MSSPFVAYREEMERRIKLLNAAIDVLLPHVQHTCRVIGDTPETAHFVDKNTCAKCVAIACKERAVWSRYNDVSEF